MALFGKKGAEPDASDLGASAAADPAPVVFLPEASGPDPGVARAEAIAPALEWTIKARPLTAEVAPLTPLQEQMAKIAKKYKDAPIEDMAKPIREALAANGREVPDDWILAIAEGLRQRGPISLNLGGPGPAPS